MSRPVQDLFGVQACRDAGMQEWEFRGMKEKHKKQQQCAGTIGSRVLSGRVQGRTSRAFEGDLWRGGGLPPLGPPIVMLDLFAN